MLIRKIRVKVNNSYRVADLKISDDKEITFKLEDYEISRKGDYPFMILKEIRLQLEKYNIFLLINGSRIDVYPSGLSLPGFNAYVQIIGQATLQEQLVNIFEETDQIELVGTVEEQMRYHANWVEALKEER